MSNACIRKNRRLYLFGDLASMSKRKASKRRFCEWALNRVNYHVKSHQGEADGSFEGSDPDSGSTVFGKTVSRLAELINNDNKRAIRGKLMALLRGV